MLPNCKPFRGKLPRRTHLLSRSLEGLWILNENSGNKVFDLSGRGHHGTLTGGATWTVGKYGTAIDMDGADGHIMIPNHAGLKLNYNWTWHILIYYKGATSSSYQYPIAKGDATKVGEGAFNLLIHKGLHNLYAYVRRDDDSAYRYNIYYDFTTKFLNKWVSVAQTFSNGKMRLYVNGVLCDTYNLGTAGIFQSVKNLCISSTDGVKNFFKGTIDSAMVWKRTLSASEIALLSRSRFVCMFK